MNGKSIEMKSVNKRAIQKKQTKELILSKATELFARKDYYEILMDDIAHHSKLAKGTLYNYFRSKDQLYNEIILNNLKNLLNQIKNISTNEQSIIEALHNYINTIFHYFITHKNFFRVYIKYFSKDLEEYSSKIRTVNEELISTLSNIIYKGKREKIFRDIDEDFAVRMILGNIMNSARRFIENNFSDSQLSKEKEDLFDYVLHGIHSRFETSDILPLNKKTIVLTRTVEQSSESATAFTELGAKVIIFPTLEIVPPQNWNSFDEVVLDKKKIDFLIFTSAHTVAMFSQRIRELGIDFSFSKTKVVAIGSKTSQICKQHNIPVNIIPEKFSGEGVVEALAKFILKNKLVFIPRSSLGRTELPKGLSELGAIIKTAPVYDVSLPRNDVIEDNLSKLRKSKPDAYVFTSPSTFENFLTIMNIDNPVNFFKNVDVAAIGPTTKAAIESKKVRVNIMPSEYTINGLANKMIEYYKTKGK